MAHGAPLRKGKTMIHRAPLSAAILTLAALPFAAQAQIEARFIESAPKDTFAFVNKGCAMDNVELILDMAESAGGLIFDTEGGGAGVEVFQPFEAVSGQIASVTVSDGAGSLSMSVPNWPEGGALSFTIDVDDVLRHGERGQTQVTGSEIAGASLVVKTADQTALGSFDTTNRAVLTGLCVS
jgi:hypothetical protein